MLPGDDYVLYCAQRTPYSNKVTIHSWPPGQIAGVQEELLPRRERNLDSPSEFNWGYAGTGPACLARELLAHALGDEELAQDLAYAFKLDFIARQEEDEWQVSREFVQAWAERELEREQAIAAAAAKDAAMPAAA